MSKPYWLTVESKCPACEGKVKHHSPPARFSCLKCGIRFSYREYIMAALNNPKLDLSSIFIIPIFEKLYGEVNK